MCHDAQLGKMQTGSLEKCPHRNFEVIIPGENVRVNVQEKMARTPWRMCKNCACSNHNVMMCATLSNRLTDREKDKQRQL